jgi:hypothetical protein
MRVESHEFFAKNGDSFLELVSLHCRLIEVSCRSIKLLTDNKKPTDLCPWVLSLGLCPSLTGTRCTQFPIDTIGKSVQIAADLAGAFCEIRY